VEQLVERFAFRSDATVRVVRRCQTPTGRRGGSAPAAAASTSTALAAANFKPGRERGESALSEPETAAVYDDITSFRARSGDRLPLRPGGAVRQL